MVLLVFSFILFYLYYFLLYTVLISCLHLIKLAVCLGFILYLDYFVILIVCNLVICYSLALFMFHLSIYYILFYLLSQYFLEFYHLQCLGETQSEQ